MPLQKTILETIRRRHKLSAKSDVRIVTLAMETKAVDAHAFTARVTTDDLDRHGEVVLPQGGDLTEFLSTGILAWNHDYDSPVGFPDKSKRVIRTENSIDVSFRFMERPADWDGPFLPDMARAFVSQALAAGIKPGVSIGFVPLETRRPTQKDIERWGEGLEYVYSKWKLLEVSVAPVQANAAAVGIAVGKGLISQKDARELWGVEAPIVTVPTVTVPLSLAPEQVKRVRLTLTTERAPNADEIVRMALAKRCGRIYL